MSRPSSSLFHSPPRPRITFLHITRVNNIEMFYALTERRRREIRFVHNGDIYIYYCKFLSCSTSRLPVVRRLTAVHNTRFIKIKHTFTTPPIYTPCATRINRKRVTQVKTAFIIPTREGAGPFRNSERFGIYIRPVKFVRGRTTLINSFVPDQSSPRTAAAEIKTQCHPHRRA